MRSPTSIVMAVVVLAGCVSSGAGRSAVSQPQRHLLTREEILNSTYRDLDLFQAVRGLRPNFLEPPAAPRSRASSASLPTAVYIDRMLQTGLAALRTIRASDVDEVRYLDPTASQSELGPSAAGGALIIKLHKPSPADDSMLQPSSDHTRTIALDAEPCRMAAVLSARDIVSRCT